MASWCMLAIAWIATHNLGVALREDFRVDDIINTIGLDFIKTTGLDNPYKKVVAASAPVATFCAWWVQQGMGKGFYNTYSSLCGISGEDTDDLNAHIEKVWNLILDAYDSIDPGRSDVLRVFVTPEWTFRRYPWDERNKQTYEYAKPLSGFEIDYIVRKLEHNLIHDRERDFTHWLIVPGTTYWGIPLKRKLPFVKNGETIWPEYAIFNTMFVFYRKHLLHLHNKVVEADLLNQEKEIWGYSVLMNFPEKSSDCSWPGHGNKRVCGAQGFTEWVSSNVNDREAHYLQEYGLLQTETALVINGLLVGLDICADHRARSFRAARAVDRLSLTDAVDKFDLQILVSSGMSFSVPEADEAISLFLVTGGMAISSDGIYGAWQNASRLFVKKESEIFPVHWSRGKPMSFYGLGKPLTLSTDYEEKIAIVSNSWSQKSNCDTDMDPLCKLCTVSKSRDALRDWIGTKVDAMCLSEPGNWRILKTWGGPSPRGSTILLPSPQWANLAKLEKSFHISLLADVLFA